MKEQDKKGENLVSILCTTYNHAKYIRQALDSFLMQKTDFNFEVLINDDASTDGTTEIIKEYAEKYPSIIKPVFHDENLYSKGYRNMMIRFLLPEAKGKYIALCEGDDYWTDKNKLQSQVDFLENNPDYALCFHSVKITFENNEEPDTVYPDRKKVKEFNANELLKGNFIQTNSVMYRKQEYKNMPTDIMPGDWYLHLYHTKFGKIGFLNKTMSVYRRHPGGVWWDSYAEMHKILAKHGVQHLNFYLELLKLYKHNMHHRETIYNSLSMLLEQIIEADKKHNYKILQDSLKTYPIELAEVLIDENTINVQLHQGYDELLLQKEKLKHDVDRLGLELKTIKSSRTWKLRNKVAKKMGKKPIY